MKKTYRGSCHCGAVRYEADIEAQGLQPSIFDQLAASTRSPDDSFAENCDRSTKKMSACTYLP